MIGEMNLNSGKKTRALRATLTHRFDGFQRLCGEFAWNYTIKIKVVEWVPRASPETISENQLDRFTAVTLCMAGIDWAIRYVTVSNGFDIEFSTNSSSRETFPSLFNCRDINLESVDENFFLLSLKEMQP